LKTGPVFTIRWKKKETDTNLVGSFQTAGLYHWIGTPS